MKIALPVALPVALLSALIVLNGLFACPGFRS